jgi:hypothetical protein
LEEIHFSVQGLSFANTKFIKRFCPESIEAYERGKSIGHNNEKESTDGRKLKEKQGILPTNSVRESTPNKKVLKIK